MNGKDKPSKLREKPTRVPSIQLERKGEAIGAYLAHLSQRPDLSEYARGVEPQFLQDYLEGMEQSLTGPKTGLYNRGRPDALLRQSCHRIQVQPVLIFG